MKKASFSGGFPLWGGALTSMGSKPGGLTKIRAFHEGNTHTKKISRHGCFPLCHGQKGKQTGTPVWIPPKHLVAVDPPAFFLFGGLVESPTIFPPKRYSLKIQPDSSQVWKTWFHLQRPSGSFHVSLRECADQPPHPRQVGFPPKNTHTQNRGDYFSAMDKKKENKQEPVSVDPPKRGFFIQKGLCLSASTFHSSRAFGKCTQRRLPQQLISGFWRFVSVRQP